MSRLISSEATGHDERSLDRALRPQVFEDFVGQGPLIRNLKVFVQGARARVEALDHVLFYGPPGLGKTTLAQIVARELQVGFRATSGPVLAKAGDLAAILSNLEPNDVLFIDEIHRLNPAVEEILYPAMEDYVLDLIIGEGPAARTVRIDLPPFTLVGATTRAGLLSTPLRDRFGIPLRLEFYNEADLIQVIMGTARKMECAINEAGAREVAKRARGTPRVAGRLLRRVRDFAHADGHDLINAEAATKALKRLEVDDFGLDQLDRKYLKVMIEHYGGGPVGLETLAAAIAESRDAVEDMIEPYLLQQGFIARTQRGRTATPKAYGHLGLSLPENWVPVETEDDRLL
jgi:Holliday junction DNA helicase RuvB